MAAYSRRQIRAIASQQRTILICILIIICLMICQVLVPQNLRLIVSVVYLLVGCAFVSVVPQLAFKLYGPAMGVILTLLQFIPCLNLLALLVLTTRAAAVLKEHGVQVGLLGADLSTLP